MGRNHRSTASLGPQSVHFIIFQLHISVFLFILIFGKTFSVMQNVMQKMFNIEMIVSIFSDFRLLIISKPFQTVERLANCKYRRGHLFPYHYTVKIP